MAKVMPTVLVVTSELKGEVVITVLEFSVEPTSPAAPASIWEKRAAGEPKLALDLHRVTDRSSRKLTFETFDQYANPLDTGSVYIFLPWWGKNQLETAQSSPERWAEHRLTAKKPPAFPATDGLFMTQKLQITEPDPFAKLARAAWEHQLCELCSATISLHEDGHRVCYTDGKVWLCEACYDRYIWSGFGERLGELIPNGR